MESCWDLYVAYVNKCVADNWANDIDPAHYEMEWNHFLPQCVFGDWPVGQWLTLRQHAIASALQSLAFKKNCMFGWHKKYLPNSVYELAWPLFVRMCGENGSKNHQKKNDEGKSLLGIENGKRLHSLKTREGKCVNSMRGGKKAHEGKDERGKSVLGTKNGRKNSKKLHEEKDEHGRSVHAMKTIVKCHEKKDEKGKSIQGLLNAERINKEKDERGKSVNSVKAARKTNSQKWKCLVTGHISTSGPLSQYQRARGIDPDLRVKVF